MMIGAYNMGVLICNQEETERHSQDGCLGARTCRLADPPSVSSCKSAKTAANGAPTKAIESKGDVPAKLSVDSEHNAAEFKTRNAGNGASMAYASHRIWTQSSQQACSKIPGFIQYWVDYTTAGLSGNKSPVLSANCSLKTFEYWSLTLWSSKS